MNLIDTCVLIVLGALVLVGWHRGLVGQCLMLAATLLSLIVAAAAGYLVATRPEGGPMAAIAAPLVFFLAFGLSGWLTQLVARGVTGIVHRLPFATLDRVLGAMVSLVVGLILLSVLALGLMSAGWEPVTRVASAARATTPLIEAGRRVTETGARYATLFEPLAQSYAEAAESIRR